MKNAVPNIKRFLESDEPFLWSVDDRVLLDGSWDDFYDEFRGCEADLLAANIRTMPQDPDWVWWRSLKYRDLIAVDETALAALTPIVRLSREAAKAVVSGLRAGWSGHPEVLIATLVNREGLRVEDIGGGGSFTPTERRGKWYDSRTFHWKAPILYVPGKLHFPVSTPAGTLAKPALPVKVRTEAPRILFVSPVGRGSADLLPETIQQFRKANADLWFFKYDDGVLNLPPDSTVVRESAQKWQLAVRYLRPEALLRYDYIFYWDDDIEVGEFDPLRFVRIMEKNRLGMAQPAILSPHRLSHEITARKVTPPSVYRDEAGLVQRVAGRLTNFVEIMVPVFSRESWSIFYEYLSENNLSGWGYDHIPIERRGIVDLMAVTHTRPVQSHSAKARSEMATFLGSQGLFPYEPAEYGWIFE